MFNLVKKGGLFTSALVAMLMAAALMPGAAFAQIELPTAAVLADIALIVAFFIAVGGAILGMIYVARGFKWAKGAG